MKNNSMKYSKKVTMGVILSMAVFFFFTLSSYANENQGRGFSQADEAVLNNAKALWEAGDKTGARKLLLDFIKDESNTISEDMYLSLGRALYNYEKTDEAEKIYEKAYNTYPESEKLLRAYAGILFKNQQYGEAAPLLEKAYAASKNMEARQLVSAAQAYFLAGNPERTKQLLKEIMDKPGVSKPSVFSMLYQSCLSLGQVDEADEYLKRYIDVANKHVIDRSKDFPTASIEGSLCKSGYNADVGTPLNMDEIDSRPRVASILPPMYPIRASVEAIQGKVVLKFVVDRDGYVQEPEVISAEPEGYFEESALDALVEYRFIPAKKDGKCVACIVRMPVKYALD